MNKYLLSALSHCFSRKLEEIADGTKQSAGVHAVGDITDKKHSDPVTEGAGQAGSASSW